MVQQLFSAPPLIFHGFGTTELRMTDEFKGVFSNNFPSNLVINKHASFLN